MSEQLPDRPERRGLSAMAHRIGAMIQRVWDSTAESPHTSGPRINAERKQEMRELLRTIVMPNEYSSPFKDEVQAQLDQLEAAFPDTPHLTRWSAAYNRALTARVCAIRCAMPIGIGEANAAALQEMGFVTSFVLGDNVGMFAPSEYPEGWAIRPYNEQPDLYHSATAVIYDTDNVARVQLYYDNGASSGYAGDPRTGITILPPPEQHTVTV
jgi:hypothetical protein